jgi:diguanylate cyclase (GGDEF)-like protein
MLDCGMAQLLAAHREGNLITCGQSPDNPNRMHDAELQEELEFLRLAGRRFEQLFYGMPVPCIGLDLGGTIFDSNRACLNLFSGFNGDLFMTSAYTVLCSDDAQTQLLARMLEGVADGKPYENFEWTLRLPNGSERFLICNLLPKPGFDEEVIGAIFTGVDMTAHREYERQIEEQLRQIHDYSVIVEQSKEKLEATNRKLECLASTDSLTGLLNRRIFYELLDQAVRKGNQKMSLIMLDVDHFKLYNDSFGHVEGDHVLTSVAQCLQENSRSSDTVARYGGEEFVVLLPRTKTADAVNVAERMRSAIESAAWPLRPVTASFGVASWTKGLSPELFIQTADQALYESKTKGRNRVTLADPAKNIRAA